MNKNSKIYVAGHKGLAGSAIVRELKRKGYENIIYETHWDLDLTETPHVKLFFEEEKPEYIFNCAAHAGGIKEAIDKPAEMLIDNLRIQNNIVEYCKENGVKKLLNLGSSCIYPVNAPQPYKEEQLGTGRTDENWSYAIAKLAGIELCRAYHKQYGCNFITAIPCNLYGINDNFDLDKAHVIPALIRKIHEADFECEVWGNGEVNREFLYVDDFAKAAVMLMENYNYEDLYDGVINIGNGNETIIYELAGIIRNIINPLAHLTIYFNELNPSGVKSKLLNSTRIKALGWQPKTSLEEGIKKTYEWYKENSSHS